MASSSSQSAQVTVSDEHERKTKRMKEAPKVSSSSDASEGSMEGRPWTQMEDIKLLKHVVVHGGRKWTKLSLQLHGRSPDSCKVRWFNKWNPLLERRFGRDAERYLVKRDDDRARKHTRQDSSSAGTDDVRSDSAVVPLEGPAVDESDLSLSTENRLEIDFIGTSMSKGISDHGGLTAKGDKDMASKLGANPSSPVFPSMNLMMNYPIDDNQQPPSSPKFIDFLGVGSV